METLVLFFITLGIIILKKTISKARFLKKRRKTNKLLEQKLKEENFKPTKTINVLDSRTINSLNEDRQKIFVDAKNKKLFLTDYANQKFYNLNFSDVVGCEIFETNSISGKRRDLENWCNSLKLIIKINNMDMPQISYDIVVKAKVDKESNIYSTLRNSTQEVKAFFDVINSEPAATKSKKFVYCIYCGAKNHADSLKCESCGGDLK
ncbi:MAG: hypothetical protein IJ310_01525 [Clostridia bacterium]|nr:hypothetical protein [Clostridia bacterium]